MLDETNPEGEGHQPTPEEVQKAEEMLSPEELKLTEIRDETTKEMEDRTAETIQGVKEKAFYINPGIAPFHRFSYATRKRTGEDIQRDWEEESNKVVEKRLEAEYGKNYKQKVRLVEVKTVEELPASDLDNMEYGREIKVYLW